MCVSLSFLLPLVGHGLRPEVALSLFGKQGIRSASSTCLLSTKASGAQSRWLRVNIWSQLRSAPCIEVPLVSLMNATNKLGFSLLRAEHTSGPSYLQGSLYSKSQRIGFLFSFWVTFLPGNYSPLSLYFRGGDFLKITRWAFTRKGKDTGSTEFCRHGYEQLVPEFSRALLPGQVIHL